MPDRAVTVLFTAETFPQHGTVQYRVNLHSNAPAKQLVVLGLIPGFDIYKLRIDASIIGPQGQACNAYLGTTGSGGFELTLDNFVLTA